MKENTWVQYLKKIWKIPAFLGVCAGIMTVVFVLYDLPLEPVVYGGILCLMAGAASFFCGYYRYAKKKRQLEEAKNRLGVDLEMIKEPEDKLEELYQEMLLELNRQRMVSENRRANFLEELTDYYGMWVHQIKTPIAALRLLLQEKPEENKEELAELFKVEQYVEMVLGYLRTEDISADMNFAECSLDKIVREQIHKYARIFIGRKIGLDYQGVEEHVLTDSKWLGFVIGQIFSNALKYTKTGQISIYMCESRPDTLVIEDTGIGISPQDLPRVFEKGFTGYNGRGDNRSTGIGLYLCAKIMKKLGHNIYIESTPGKGTKVYLNLKRERLEMM